ncbi:MAG: hypothetical protein K8S16_12245, partial [Bacteroidales bacterium]|nr:hypothetical protein [Bacteroidales bacterium]
HEITNELGFNIQLNYTGDRLTEIIDSCNRTLRIEHDFAGRISAVVLTGKTDVKLIAYTYNAVGDMTGIFDSLDQVTTIEYKNHLMVKKTDRNGQAFYWEYDGKEPGARCVHTWGDGGLQEGWIQYFPEKGYNIVTNSLGAKTTYYYTPDNIVTEIKDALGNSSFTDYTPFSEIYREIDEEGNMTGYTYDERGNRTGMVLPDGTQYMNFYDEQDRLILADDPEGNSMLWIYDEQSRVINTISPDGASTSFEYNEQNLISKIINAAKNEILLEYDEQHNLKTMLLPNGGKAKWYYNQRGDVILVENPEGATQSFTYDKLGRPVHIQQADLNNIKLQYNAYDEVIRAKDNFHHVKFDYTPLGSLKMREENGTKVFFNYDNDEQLKKIINEHGETYRFERNQNGDITLEEGFDGITRIYKRDHGGKVVRVERPGDKWTEYEYDATGKITRAENNDGTWETYSYDKRGLLTEAVNQHSELILKRDKMGRVVEEKQGEHQVFSQYDKNGNRIKIESSLGADIDVEYNHMDDVIGMAASNKSDSEETGNDNDKWEAKITRNALGQEIERSLTGGVKSQMYYDFAGRPTGQRVQSGKTVHRHRTYKWNANDRLNQMLNELTGGLTTYTHDDFGNLASARYEDGSYDYKLPDEVGNLYRTPNRDDRKYGKGGRLLVDDSYHYEYDKEGNLIKKTGLGDVWEYHWYGNGMLKSVGKNEFIIAEFEYDALGRRTVKIIRNPAFTGDKGDVINRFVWDGNVPLHEWRYDLKDRPQTVIDELGFLTKDKEEPTGTTSPLSGEMSKGQKGLITWIFEEGTFKPSAKIIDEEKLSIITDYLGTPVEMYNSLGEKTWEVEYDIYGKIRKLTKGSLNDCPFRYQGQYEDEETELYYNRFRYFSPDEGMYVSQDPIGLSGGLIAYFYTKDPNLWVDVLGLQHTASWQLRDSNGQIITGGKMVSGSDTPPGRRLSWTEQAEVHTETKIMKKIEGTVEPGQILTIQGTKPPCNPGGRGCQNAMQDFANKNDVKVIYTDGKQKWEFKPMCK